MRAFLTGLMLLGTAAAAETPTPAALQGGLAGQWRGALGYRDYQTDALFELAVDTEIRALPDGVTVVRVSSFDDGPKVGLVYITTASLYDAKAGTVSAAMLRKGRAAELTVDSVAVTAYSDPAHWTMRYERDGTDGDSPAKIRTTETRDGDTVLAVKDVLPATATDGKWRFRNQLRLTRR